jgi:glycosyltransferase involved in cell wall biosynthesis
MKIIICGPAYTDEMCFCIRQAPVPTSRAIRNMLEQFCINSVPAQSVSFIANKIMNKRLYQLIDSESKKDYGGRFIVKSRFILKSVIQFQRTLLQMAECTDIVLFHNMIYPYYGLAARLKKVHAVPILIFSDYTQPWQEKKLHQKIFARLAKREFFQFDKVISFADFNGKLFHRKVRPLILRGGISYASFNQIQPPRRGRKIRILYAGTLSKAAGIDVFLEAVHLMIDVIEAEYYISGRGPLENMVKDAAERIPEIHYMGFIREENYYSFLENMNVFVNPRNMRMDENQNNFPSKILDYLAAGRVIVSSKFSGWQEFDGYAEWYSGSAKELSETLRSIIQKYDKIAGDVYQANRSLAEKYDWSIQAEKILEYINETP